MKAKMTFGLLLTMLFVLHSCSENDEISNEEKTGRLSIRLIDAPFPYDLVEEANVTVFKVEARRSDDTKVIDEESMDEDDSENSPFVILMETEITVNLLNLTNGTTAMLADLEVPTGTYDLIRVYVKGVNVLLTDGRSFDLNVPSGEQTGIKVFVKPGITVAGGLSSDLLLDFDVSRSFVARGNTKKVDGINGFNFKPVIKASNLSTAGSLLGNVSAMQEEMAINLEGAQVSVWAADTLNTTAFTDIDGNYMVMGLEAGTYKVFSELEGYMPSDTLDVAIVTANKAVQDFILKNEETEETEGN